MLLIEAPCLYATKANPRSPSAGLLPQGDIRSPQNAVARFAWPVHTPIKGECSVTTCA